MQSFINFLIFIFIAGNVFYLANTFLFERISGRYENKHNLFRIMEIEYDGKTHYVVNIIWKYLYGIIPLNCWFINHTYDKTININGLDITLFKSAKDASDILQQKYREYNDIKRIKKLL